MKGIETLPFQLIASLVLISVVVAVGWYEIGQFLSFMGEKDFKEGTAGIYQTMRNLQALSDYGAFSGISFKIPAGYILEIDSNADTIIAKGGGQEIVKIPPSGATQYCIDIIGFKKEDAGVLLDIGTVEGPNNVELRILYLPDVATATSVAPQWSISFKDKAVCR